MRIGIDARFYGPRSKGLGRYTEQLIRYLERHDTENEYVLFLQSPEYDAYVPRNPRFQKVRADVPWYSFAEQWRMPLLLYRARCDLVHFPHFNVPLLYRRRFVVTVHDLILLRFPTVRATTRRAWVYWLKFIAYKVVIRSAMWRAARIIVPSHFTKQDILSWLPTMPSRRIAVTYEAATPPATSTEDATAVIAEYGIMEPYVLYVGNAYPHKNLARLVRAFAAARVAATHTLVLVGKDDAFYCALQRDVIAACGAPVRVLYDVPERVLHALYRRATCFVFPSLYEGFGLPPLEAMYHDCPVVASRASCMPEIIGDAALFFDPEDCAAMARAIDRVCTDRALRAELVARGRVRVRRYAWSRLGRATRAIYAAVENTKNVKRSATTD